MAEEKKPATTKVRLLVATRGAGVGDTIEVDAAAAKQLVADRQATLDASKPKKSTANADRRKAAARS